MDNEELIARIELVLKQLEDMHTNVVARASMMRVRPSELLLPNGDSALAPIFIAQAHALSALALLRATK